MERPGSESADHVHRAVLGQPEVPELYALASKFYSLEQGLAALEPLSGG